MKKLWQMIKGCPLFSILIISGVIVTAGGYVGAALGVYKWDVSFHHPMAQTVLLDERVATGTDATSTDAPGKSELTSESTGSAAAEEQTTEVKSRLLRMHPRRRQQRNLQRKRPPKRQLRKKQP